jgi:hypothetical protein
MTKLGGSDSGNTVNLEDPSSYGIVYQMKHETKDRAAVVLYSPNPILA